MPALSLLDFDIIGEEMRGMRLPYSTFTDEELREKLAYKRNNLAAIVVCGDGLHDYVNDDDLHTTPEMVSMFKDDLAMFCLYGLISIGFFGTSVENGKPKMIDSCGKNIGALYGSIYEKMTGEEYAKRDRIESLLIDQRDQRRFVNYLRNVKKAALSTLVSQMDEQRFAEDGATTESRLAEKCLSADGMFLQILQRLGRTYAAAGSPKMHLHTADAERLAAGIRELSMPYRKLLEDDDVPTLKTYTTTDMKPIRV